MYTIEELKTLKESYENIIAFYSKNEEDLNRMLKYEGKDVIVVVKNGDYPKFHMFGTIDSFKYDESVGSLKCIFKRLIARRGSVSNGTATTVLYKNKPEYLGNKEIFLISDNINLTHKVISDAKDYINPNNPNAIELFNMCLDFYQKTIKTYINKAILEKVESIISNR